MTKALTITGLVLLALGALWWGQGNGYVQGSFMTGDPTWSNIGAALVGVGAFLLFLAYARRRAARPPRSKAP